MTCALPNRRVPTRDDWQRLSGALRADLDARIHYLLSPRDMFTECVGCGPGPRRLLDP